MNKFIKIRQFIQSNIDRWQTSINTYLKAISDHTPELFNTIGEHTAYSAFLTNQLELHDLNNFINRLPPKLSNAELKKHVINITQKIDEVSSKLNDQMSKLLQDFTQALLTEKEKEFESFSSKIRDTYLAVLLDNTETRDRPSTRLTDKLSSLINSKNFPEQYKKSFTHIINSLTTSSYSPMCAQYALAKIKSTIEFAQTHANKIISSNLPTEETIKKLIEELSDEFYIGRFIASFKSFQSIHQANQEQRADIEARFTQLESHCPRCEELKSLISEWRIELDKLQSNTLQDHTLDNISELSEQLGKFKDKLERGDYFQKAKETILSYLTSWEGKVISIINRHKKPIQQLAARTGNNPSDTIPQLYKKYKRECCEIQELWKNHKDNYLKQQLLSEMLALKKNILEKTNDNYTTSCELEEYELVDEILKGNINQNFETKIKNLFAKDSTLKRLSYKFFFMLRTTDSDEQKIDYFKNLTQFLETKEVPPNEAGASFKKTFKKAITEIFLEDWEHPDCTLKEVGELLRFKENAGNLLLLAPEKINWLNDLKKIIDAFEKIS